MVPTERNKLSAMALYFNPLLNCSRTSTSLLVKLISSHGSQLSKTIGSLSNLSVFSAIDGVIAAPPFKVSIMALYKSCGFTSLRK